MLKSYSFWMLFLYKFKKNVTGILFMCYSVFEVNCCCLKQVRVSPSVFIFSVFPCRPFTFRAS